MKDHVDEELTDKLTEDYACYVLITCDHPLQDGQMNVKMSYEGDPTLAAYLLQGAQTFLEEQDEG